MIHRFSLATARWLILLAAALAYFVIFPEDLAALLAPVSPLVKTLAEIASVSHAISPWLYGLLAALAICWTLRTIWRRPAA